jgi:predicted 3-demethylubiquinone-9 3-methyltransferase (glyoxalase superfamily)
MPRISPFLWFDTQAEEAAKLYVSVFPNSKILNVSRYTTRAPGGPPEGSVMTVEFEVDGQRVIALNAGPQFKLTEAFSFSVECETQEEVDRYWDKLTAGGGTPGPCGWLKDRYGLSWQVQPTILSKMLSDRDAKKAARVMQAMLKMKKIEIPELKRAYEGASKD